MGIALYGNINQYKTSGINLLNKTKKADDKIKQFNTIKDAQAVKMNISKEGLKALHGSDAFKSNVTDLEETQRQIEYWSNHQPLESYSSKFNRMLPNNYELGDDGNYQFVNHTLEEKENVLVDGFKKLYNEIVKGYEDGTRVRYVEDSLSKDGFRKLTKDEEMNILQEEFDNFVDNKFGKEYQKQINALKTFQEQISKIKKKQSNVILENVPKDFIKNLKNKIRNIAVK